MMISTPPPHRFTRLDIFFLSLAILALFAISFNRVAPFFWYDQDTALIYLAQPENQLLHNNLWNAAGIFSLMAALWIRWRYGSMNALIYRLPFLIALTICLASTLLFATNDRADRAGLPDNWNTFYLIPDSASYVFRYGEISPPPRPPVYPLFIEIVTSGTGFNHRIDGMPRGVPINDTSLPLMRVARAQKTLLLIAILTICFALMGLVDPPLVALGFLWLFDYNFFVWEMSFILTEPVAQALLLLLLAALFFFVKYRSKYILTIAGILCALLYLTRPAAAFSGIILAGLLFSVLATNFKTYWKTALISIAIPAILVSLPVIDTYLKNGLLKPSPMYYVPRVAFAMQVMEYQDLSLMPDDLSRKFFNQAWRRKRIQDEKIRAEFPYGTLQISWLLSHNINTIAMPLANELLPAAPQSEIQNLLLKVSDPIMQAHRDKYYIFALQSFILTTTKGTRLQTDAFKFWNNFWLCMLLIVLLRGWVGGTSLLLIGTHLAHMAVVSLFDAPTPRYIESTEFLVLIAYGLLCWGMGDAIFHIVIRRSVLIERIRRTISLFKLRMLPSPVRFTPQDIAQSTEPFTLILYRSGNRPPLNNAELFMDAIKTSFGNYCQQVISLTPENPPKETLITHTAHRAVLVDLALPPPDLDAIAYGLKQNNIPIITGLHGTMVDGKLKISQPCLTTISMLLTSSPAPDLSPNFCILNHLLMPEQLSWLAMFQPQNSLPTLTTAPHPVAQLITALSRNNLPAAYYPALKSSDNRLREIQSKAAFYYHQWDQIFRLALSNHPLRLLMPTTLLIALPGLVAANRFLEGRGGKVSISIAFTGLLCVGIWVSTSLIYDAWIKRRPMIS